MACLAGFLMEKEVILSSGCWAFLSIFMYMTRVVNTPNCGVSVFVLHIIIISFLIRHQNILCNFAYLVLSLLGLGSVVQP